MIDRRTISATLAIAFGAALVLIAGQAQAQGCQALQKCFGTSLRGQNDCGAGPATICAATCAIIQTPKGTVALTEEA